MKRLTFLPACLLIMLTLHLQAQYTPWDIIYCINGGENKSVGISKLDGPNPLEKPGWNLIFNDEFGSSVLNPDYWNRSTPWDDGDGTCVHGFVENPANATIDSGMAYITNTIEAYLPGCPYSGGEIKTFSVSDAAFKSFYFYAPGYIEARVKLFNRTGQGAAFWLWGVGTPENPGTPGPWNEIDIFELNGINGNIFSGSYHWTPDGNHVSQNHSIYLTDSARLYDLSANWTIFGLEWDSDSIKWYVNNLPVKVLNLHGIPPYCVSSAYYDPPLAPFSIRLNTRQNTVGNQSAVPNPADFPQSMLVDYVRAYKKNGEKAAPVIMQDRRYQMCSSDSSFATSDKLIRTRYYPGAVYSWSSPAFELAPEPVLIPEPPEKLRIWIKPGIKPGNTYPLYLHTTFPQGYAEDDSALIYIAPAPPELPPDEFLPLPIDSLCYFSLSAVLQPEIETGEFSLDNGSSWKQGTIKDVQGNRVCLFGNFKPGREVQFAFRITNECGYSPARFSTRTMPPPSPGCKWPDSVDDTIESRENSTTPLVTLSPNPVLDNLIIRLYGSLQHKKNNLHLSMYDIHGRCVLKSHLTENINQLVLSYLHPGLYCILFVQDNTIIFKSTFLKQ